MSTRGKAKGSNAKIEGMILTIKGKPVGPGTIMLIKGERGQFTFKHPSWNAEGKLILNFVGGVAGHYSWRSFYADRVRKVL